MQGPFGGGVRVCMILVGVVVELLPCFVVWHGELVVAKYILKFEHLRVVHEDTGRD
jgi:hypothetical protein